MLYWELPTNYFSADCYFSLDKFSSILLRRSNRRGSAQLSAVSNGLERTQVRGAMSRLMGGSWEERTERAINRPPLLGPRGGWINAPLAGRIPFLHRAALSCAPG